MAEYDVTFIEHDHDRARFLVRGITPAFANGIRRAMVAGVPTFSVDTIRVIENTSVMFDEQIGLRLGLVPLTTPESGYVEGDTVTLSLDVSGPATAYSGDMVSTDEAIVPANDSIPVIDLKEDQRIELEAEAVLDSGRTHAKHQGGVAVGYRHLQRVVVDGDREAYADDERQIVRGVVEDDGELVPTEEFDHDLTELYPEKAVHVEDIENAFVFHVETDESFSAERLVLDAVESLGNRADQLNDAVQL